MSKDFHISANLIKALFQKALTLKQIRILLFLLNINPEKALREGLRIPKLSYFTSAGIHPSDISRELKVLYESGIINYDKQKGIYKINSVSDWKIDINTSVLENMMNNKSNFDENLDYLEYLNSKDIDYTDVKLLPEIWE